MGDTKKIHIYRYISVCICETVQREREGDILFLAAFHTIVFSKGSNKSEKEEELWEKERERGIYRKK